MLQGSVEEIDWTGSGWEGEGESVCVAGSGGWAVASSGGGEKLGGNSRWLSTRDVTVMPH